MFKVFAQKVRTGLGNFFNSHLPRATEHTNRFIGSLLDAGRGYHKVMSHVNQEVGKSDLFSPEVKQRFAKAHAFSDTGLQKMTDIGGKVQQFSTGIGQFRLT